MSEFKSGFAAILGRPNVGKSTLLNTILGQKIVIATDKAQTTRKRIKGIFTNDEGQIVFIDTPGIHKPLDKLGEFLIDEVKSSVPDADVILFLVDVSEPAGAGDKWIAENILKDIKKPVIIVLNKVDKIKDPVKTTLRRHQPTAPQPEILNPLNSLNYFIKNLISVIVALIII